MFTPTLDISNNECQTWRGRSTGPDVETISPHSLLKPLGECPREGKHLTAGTLRNGRPSWTIRRPGIGDLAYWRMKILVRDIMGLRSEIS